MKKLNLIIAAAVLATSVQSMAFEATTNEVKQQWNESGDVGKSVLITINGVIITYAIANPGAGLSSLVIEAAYLALSNIIRNDKSVATVKSDAEQAMSGFYASGKMDASDSLKLKVAELKSNSPELAKLSDEEVISMMNQQFNNQ